MIATDRAGHELHAPDAESVERYDRALDLLLTFSDQVVDAWEETVADEPGFVMGQVGRAYLRCVSSEGPDAADAREILSGIGDAELTERERRHVEAAWAYAGGDLAGARETLARLTVEHPRDALALIVGHQLDFFCGDAQTLRDRIARTLLSWDVADPRYGYVQGMLAFGLEETGAYDRARDAGYAALDRDPRDVWAIHAVAHTYEMEGCVDDGLALYEQRRDAWATGNIFTVHNSWHEALYLLETEQTDRVLAIYDASIHHDGSEKVALEMLDASALLWRLHLDGVDTGGRWEKLADAWAEKDPSPWYVFNDMHAAMAYVGAGRLEDARAVVDRLAAYAAEPPGDATNVMMTSDVGLPVCAAILAFGEGRYDDVVALLHPIRTYVQRFGGSHAQRDVVARTLLEGAIRSGDAALARALVSERLALKPQSRYAARQRERIEVA